MPGLPPQPGSWSIVRNQEGAVVALAWSSKPSPCLHIRVRWTEEQTEFIKRCTRCGEALETHSKGAARAAGVEAYMARVNRDLAAIRREARR